MAKEKKQNNIVRNMMIALVGGLVVGLGFMLLKQQMSEGTWNVINALLFQDITADQGFHSIGLFYIIGQRTADGNRTAGTCILKPCNVQYLQLFQAGKNRRTYIDRILLFLCSRRMHRRYRCICNEIRRLLQC